MLVLVKKRVWGDQIIPVQNVIGLKSQLSLKVLLANQWSLAPRWGAIEVPRKKR
jgi:hypothetical protein